jgi:hypothetical protein
MPLHKKTYTIDNESSRDHGKTFLLEEMDAYRAEDWAHRAILAVVKNGRIPDTEEMDRLKDIDWDDPATANLGMGLVAAMGIRAFAGLDYADAKPLLDELMDCVQIMGDPNVPATAHKPLRGEIEDFKTLTLLKLEVFQLITGFSMGGVLSRLTSTGGTPQTPTTSTRTT